MAKSVRSWKPISWNCRRKQSDHIRVSEEPHLCLGPSLLAPRRERLLAGRRKKSLNSKWRTDSPAVAGTGHVAAQRMAQEP